MKPLFGVWDLSGALIVDDRTIKVTGRATIEPFGELVVVRSTLDPPEFPDTLSIIDGDGDGDAEPARMHYFDTRGVIRAYLTTVTAGVWTIWRADESWRASPGFNQRYVGTIAPDGSRITGGWERGLGDAGDRWEVDFRLDYTRVG